MTKCVDGYREELETRKRASTLQLLFRAARLANERSVTHVRQTRPRSAGIRTAHTTLFPHISLEGTRLTDLARSVGISKQAVAQLVDELEAMGMVERRPDPDDGRAKLIRFSRRGRTALFEGLDALDEVEAQLAREVGASHLETLNRELRRLLRVLDAEER